MASNIEIKARITGDVDAVHARAAAIADTGPTLIEQRDTFFVTSRGRLKLREFGGVCGSAERGDVAESNGGCELPANALAELIYYERPDADAPTASTYSRIVVSDPDALKAALATAIGVRGVVSKHRTLYVARETRIHIDNVDGLGAYLELEVVLGSAEGAASPGEGARRCSELMAELGVADADLVDTAYIDLLEEAHR